MGDFYASAGLERKECQAREKSVALVIRPNGMFEQALKVICQLPASNRVTLIARLDRVRTMSHNLGYGVGDDMDSLLVDYTGN